MTSIEMFYGWVSPQGVFHQVNYGEHTRFAYDSIVGEEGTRDLIWKNIDIRDYCVEKLGWILFDSPTWEAPYPQYEMGKINKSQIEAILELYHDMMRECYDYRDEAEANLYRFLDQIDY